MVRAERIELSSHAWKARILAIIRRPHEIIITKIPSKGKLNECSFILRLAYAKIKV